MPENFNATITAEQLRKGDTLAAYGQVTQLDKKVKFVYVTCDNGSTKLELAAPITVVRERPTAEEKAQAELDGKLYFLDMSEQRATKELADCQRRVAEALATNDWNIAGRVQDLLIAKAVQALWARVRTVHLNYATSENLEPITRLEAYAITLERVREEVLEYSRWSSRSTSTWSNAVEDIELDAKSRFLRDAKWNVQL